MADIPPGRTVVSAVFYKDPKAALDWLQRAFGFELQMLLEDSEGRLAHSELVYGDGSVMVGGEWAEWIKSPASIGGANTQSVSVRLAKDLDAHCERSRQAGATIIAEPEDQFYGDRTYRALDLEGHMWNFRQFRRDVSIAEMEAATGLKVTQAPPDTDA